MAMKDTWHFCDGEGRLDGPKLNRRQALVGAATLAAGGVWWASARSALSQALVRQKPTTDHVLVVIFLRGGADGLNIVAPHGEDEYYKLRPSLAIPRPTDRTAKNRLIDLDGFFGLNPALSPLEASYKEGELAIVHAVGSGDETHSHFEAMSTMERGLKNQADSTGGGWLGRHLTTSSGSPSPLRAVAFSSIMPDSLGGAIGATALSSLAEFRLAEGLEIEHLRKLYARGDGPIDQAGRETLQVLDSLNRVDPRGYQPEHGAAYPDHPTSQALREVAFLIKQEMGLEVACLDVGNWDTHVAQGQTEGWLSSLLGDLGRSVAAFRKDLGSRSKKVTVVVQTEFGRRVAENSGLGTDHGAGGVLFVLGGGVKGGKVYADWPGLVPDKLVGPGDLKVTTDYRDVLAELLAARFGNHRTAEVFPGLRHRPLGLFS